MRSPVRFGIAGLAAMIALTAIASEVEPSGGASATWESGGAAGGRLLVLRFPTTPPKVDAAVAPWGLEVVVHDVGIGDPLPGDVRADRLGGATRLRVERPGIVLRGVRVGTASVVFDLLDPPTAAVGSSAYTIGVGDVLTIAVYKNPDLSGDFSVTPEGGVVMPLLGPVAAAGKTEGVLADDLTRMLAKDFLVDPQVSVSVKTYQSQFVYVTGAVQRSSRIAVRPGVTLRGVLSEAGVALSPGMTVELRRSGGATSTLEAAGLDSLSPRDGDVLTVQEPRYISIYGEVRRSNRLVLIPKMTLLQAIAMAEGLTDWANKKEVRILRKGPSGSAELSVNLRDIEDGQADDPVLQPDDVVIVKRRIL